jgi:hypothetical protein
MTGGWLILLANAQIFDGLPEPLADCHLLAPVGDGSG